MKINCTEPILLLLFNRPGYTKKLIQALEIVKPQNLYVVIDGPREGNKTDIQNVQLCTNLVNEINWGGEKTVLVRTENYGCGRGVSNAISWFFQKVSRGIILEDDCIPSPSFFSFCSKMLDLYQNDQRIMHISGTRWSEEYQIDFPYFFSTIGHIWGWATWRRAWDLYDFEMNDWSSFKTSKTFYEVNPDPNFRQYWVKTFDRFLNEPTKSTWDYQWQYTLFKSQGLAIVPRLNLISNIGEQGVHSSTKQSNVHQRKVSQDFTIADINQTVAVNNKFDTYHVKYYFQKKPPVYRRIINKFNYLFKFLKK